jgi:simple sugar transport system ATP-binding protein
VYQEINLCTNLTVAENILLGREPYKAGRIDWAKMNALASSALHDLLGVNIDVTKQLDTYTVAIQQMVAITRALYIESAKILILDEPTSSLDVNETQQLFKVMRKLKNQGVALFLSRTLLVKSTTFPNGSLSCGMASSWEPMRRAPSAVLD